MTREVSPQNVQIARQKAARQKSRISGTLFRITNSLYRFRRLDDRLEFITQEVQKLLSVMGASVILADEERQEFFFRVSSFEDIGTGKRMKEVRFPIDKGVASQVYRTGAPLLVPDTSQSPYFFQGVDVQAGYHTHNMLDVPIQIPDRTIGVICAVNKKKGMFQQTDVEFLSAIARVVAFPIENARINEALKRSYEEVQTLSRAKDRLIHHLSHELKTPVSVLSASLNILKKHLSDRRDPNIERILERAQRSLARILDMQYQVQDILHQSDYRTYQMMSGLLDICTDEIEALADETCGPGSAGEKIRSRIQELFGPVDSAAEDIDPEAFTRKIVQSLKPRFSHRQCHVELDLAPAPAVFVPNDVLSKIVEGLVRNAVENTPDLGRIEIRVRPSGSGAELEVQDYGVGITAENQKLIFESILTTRDTMQYATRNPYDFGAGGKSFDLLRMKIFSERYHFSIQMRSSRCIYIPDDNDICPGDIAKCPHCHSPEDCIRSGGTTMTVHFI